VERSLNAPTHRFHHRLPGHDEAGGLLLRGDGSPGQGGQPRELGRYPVWRDRAGEDEAPLDGQTEDQFLETGFAELVEEQTKGAQEDLVGIFATHVEMTRLVEPRAIYREAISMAHDTDVRALLSKLEMPRWYLQGEFSDPEPDFQRDMAAMGVGWRVVPETGHPMGLQNPAGLAQTVAEVLAVSWPS
jgi:pimeloyl-ACP methyl ester carboxylesterase